MAAWPLDEAIAMPGAARLAVVLLPARLAHIDRLRHWRLMLGGSTRALSAALRDPDVPKSGALMLTTSQDCRFRDQSTEAQAHECNHPAITKHSASPTRASLHAYGE